MNRRPTDLRRYVLVRNLKRYVKAHETIAPSNGNQQSNASQNAKQESIADPNIKQESIDPQNIKQEIINPQNEGQANSQACCSSNSEEPTLCTLSSSSTSNTMQPSGSVDEEVSENSTPKESAASKDTDLNTSAFAIVTSLFKPRKKRKKGVAKAKVIVKGVKCKKQPSSACVKEKESISKKPRSLFSLFKSRKDKRNNMLSSASNDPCSSVSKTTGTTSQSCQTDITWPDDGYDELQRSNQVLQESNRLLIENLSTLIQNINTPVASPQTRGICTDAYGCESINGRVEPEPSYNGSIKTEPKSPIITRSHASKLHRSQTLLENCKANKVCTRSKSMHCPERHCPPLRTYPRPSPINFPRSSAPYQLRSTILKDLPVNTNHGIHRRSSMPERSSRELMRPLLRRRSNNFFDYNHGLVTHASQNSTAPSSPKPLSENLSLNKVRKSIVRRSSMPDRVPKAQINYQRRPAVQRRNTLTAQDKHSYKQGEYNCSTRFQDLPNEAFY